MSNKLLKAYLFIFSKDFDRLQGLGHCLICMVSFSISTATIETGWALAIILGSWVTWAPPLGCFCGIAAGK